MTASFQKLLETVNWKESQIAICNTEPYITHTGYFKVNEKVVKVNKVSTGDIEIPCDELKRVFGKKWAKEFSKL